MISTKEIEFETVPELLVYDPKRVPRLGSQTFPVYGQARGFYPLGSGIDIDIHADLAD